MKIDLSSNREQARKPGMQKKQKTKKQPTIIQKDTCTLVFIAALFTVIKTWKQPICPLTDEWIKKMWYIYT